MKRLIILFLLNVLVCKNYGQTKASTTADLTKDLEQMYDQGHITGFSVAILNEDGTVFEKGFGYANKQANKKYTQNTIQPIASISKTCIAIALLKAQELGKLNLDDPINKHLPFEVANPNFPNTPITIRQLANHTSSIKDSALRYWLKAYVLKEKNNRSSKVYWHFRSSDKMMTLHNYLKKLLSLQGKWYRKRNFSKNKPGEVDEYSNVGAGLAALVLEHATGVPFDEFTKIHIFKPLEMSDTGWSIEAIDFTNHSTLYTKKGKEIAFYRNINYPDGALITSVSDQGKFLMELMSGYSGEGKILSPESYKELFKPQLEIKDNEKRIGSYGAFYNSGIFMDLTAKKEIGHGGSDPGVKTLMYFNTETKIGKILFANTEIETDEFFEIWKKLRAYEKKF